MATIKKIRINPRRKAKAAAPKARTRTAPKRKRRKPNPLLIVGNPRKSKGNAMPSPKRKKAAPRKTAKRRKPNPFKKAAAPKRRRRNPVQFQSRKRRRRNPSFAGKASGFARQAGFALGGFIITRQLPQMLLGSRNSGWLGWAANLVTLLVTSAAVSKFSNKVDGQNASVGGSLYLLSRMMGEVFSPIPKALALSGVGDPMAATSRQLGAYRDRYTPTPVGYNRDGSIAWPKQLTTHIDERVKAGSPPPAARMAGMRMVRRGA